jgi:acetyl-CoA carboxylase carboxyl transferase subunit beta
VLFSFKPMVWFRKPKYTILAPKKKDMPDGLWTKCQSCGEIVYNKKLEENFKVCPKCDYHFQMNAWERVKMLADTDTFQEYDRDMKSIDPLKFNDSKSYAERLSEAQEKTGLAEAVITGEMIIEGAPVVIGILDFSFMGGSMASVVGEKVTRAIERARERRLPLIMVCSSGGARMQEGILSLMQMSKTSAALGLFAEDSLPYIAVLTNPTTGGVSASFASLGDIVIAEPKALIGFAGPRVIKQTIQQELPPGFQTAEFLLEHGMIDMIIRRPELKLTLAKLIRFLTRNRGHNT